MKATTDPERTSAGISAKVIYERKPINIVTINSLTIKSLLPKIYHEHRKEKSNGLFYCEKPKPQEQTNLFNDKKVR